MGVRVSASGRTFMCIQRFRASIELGFQNGWCGVDENENILHQNIMLIILWPLAHSIEHLETNVVVVNCARSLDGI